MSESKIYIAKRIFTGEAWLTEHAVITENGKIDSIVSLSSLPSLQYATEFDNCFIAPAFIDLQIYGAAGKLFSVYPETDALYQLKEYCAKGGAAWCLPTVATNTMVVVNKCIDAVKEYWNGGGDGILGLHLEGPWINPIKRGAHTESLIHPPTKEEVTSLLNHGKGVIKMITLAPELSSKEIMDIILSQGIVISAGHSNATYEEAKAGFYNGITTVTHLFNAMSALQHRQPGLVGATMDDAKVMASIIPDGHHVDYAAIRIAKQVVKERLFAITDAVTTTTDGNYKHLLAGDKYEANGILSGSSLTMNKALQNLVQHAGIELSEALRMCSLYPAQVMRLEDRFGKIEKGYAASLVVLDEQLQVKQLLTN